MVPSTGNLQYCFELHHISMKLHAFHSCYPYFLFALFEKQRDRGFSPTGSPGEFGTSAQVSTWVPRTQPLDSSPAASQVTSTWSQKYGGQSGLEPHTHIGRIDITSSVLTTRSFSHPHLLLLKEEFYCLSARPRQKSALWKQTLKYTWYDRHKTPAHHNKNHTPHGK